ncbi:unnamed protein product [Alopecurus aequalis]
MDSERPAPSVQLLSVSRVAPSQQQHGGRVKLSYLDVSFVSLPAVQHLLLYDLGEREDGFPAMVARLKAALAETLTQYLPCAGRLEYEVETGDIVIDCSDPGVTFVDAQAHGMDVRRLAFDEVHDMPAFVSLVPELDARVLPAPVMSVQVTRLGACGFAVGMTMHHAVADGRAMWRFMEAWASSSREGSSPGLDPPMYSRDAVHYPRADELAHKWLKLIAPNLPVVISGEHGLTSPLLRLARRTFHISADGIRSLKRRINDLATAATGGPKLKPVSTFVALAALGWTAVVRSKGLRAGDNTYLMFIGDLRARLDPPVPNAYLGNCAAVAEMEEVPLLSYDEELADMVRPLQFSRMSNVVGSKWFQVYEVTDFGFGKPALAEVVSMNHDGEMMLLGGRQVGEVQVSVSIDPAHMAMFDACFFDRLATQSTQIHAKI